MSLFNIDDIIKDNNLKTDHSYELKQLNLSHYNYLISGDRQHDIYTNYKDKINIFFGDLDNYNDDCLVNPANELLLGGGGIDGYVHELGKEDLIKEVMKIPLNEYGCRLIEGEAVFTNGYNNKYKTFIHTVCPYYDENNNLKKDIMKKCFDNIFKIIKDKNIKSVTIPAIGTGFYGFYMYEYTIICLQKIIYYLEKNKNIEKINLVTNSKLQYNFFKIIYDDYIKNI